MWTMIDTETSSRATISAYIILPYSRIDICRVVWMVGVAA